MFNKLAKLCSGRLKEKGVAEIFTPGATTASIVDWVNANVRVAA